MSHSKEGRPQRTSFPLGEIVASPKALAQLTPEDITDALQRHIGIEMKNSSLAENQSFSQNSCRLLSLHRSARGTKFWIITEADHSLTAILLQKQATALFALGSGTSLNSVLSSAPEFHLTSVTQSRIRELAS